MRNLAFTAKGWEQFLEWSKTDVKVLKKILSLVDETRRSPFEGIGKPEALKHDLRGYWSRRITQEHRLVYEVTDQYIIVIQCKYHY